MAYDAEKEDKKKAKQNEKAKKNAEKAAKKADAKAAKEKAKELEAHAKENVDAAKNKVKGIEKEIDNLKDKNKDLEKDKKKAEKELVKLNQAEADAKARYENIYKHLNPPPGDGLYTEDDLKNAKSLWDQAISAREGCEQRIQNINSQIAANNEKIKSLEGDLTAAKKELSDAEDNYQNCKDACENGNWEEAEKAATASDPEEEEVEATNADSSNGVDEKNPQKQERPKPLVAPWDARLRRTDVFMGLQDPQERIPLSSEEGASMYSDMVNFNLKSNGHGKVVDWAKTQKGIISNDPNVYGLLSLINPYSVTRLYNSLKISFEGQTPGEGDVINVTENRMLDIRDQKRFYDKTRINGDVLTVSNPTTTNIIDIMNSDQWGRTPYTYQDFVFLKYFNRIPNNRLITLRKYAAATTDNLCWEMMGNDKKSMNNSFSPIATACTYFGGESGNSLKDLFAIESGLKWGELKADIWNVSGDSGTSPEQTADQRILDAGGTNDMDATKSNAINSMFRGGGKVLGNATSLLKFIGATGNPNVFDQKAANSEQFYANLHDPNDNGPYANRIKGPVNRIDSVMRREEGIKFNHKITLKFSYEARPIGGVNTKAAMMEIISNMLLLCSASAVFWGGGHKFMIQPHAYPWNNLDQNTRGFLKSVYNGQIFGKKGAIAQALQGIVSVGRDDGKGGQGGFNFNNVIDTMSKLGAGVMGVLGGALNTLVGSISGSLGDIGAYLDKSNELLQSKIKGINGSERGASAFTNIMKNTQSIWKSNSVKKTILPSVEGLRSLLLGTPVGNWHLTVGNPLNPIAVIGNLICQDVKFEFGEELGPDDFPMHLDCTVTLDHGMPRDLDAIESMFNRGAGRIYHAPDYIKMHGIIPVSEQETKVDAVTGGSSFGVPVAWVGVDGKARSGKYYKLSENVENKTATSVRNQLAADAQETVKENTIYDYNRGYDQKFSLGARAKVAARTVIRGNLHTRHYADS